MGRRRDRTGPDLTAIVSTWRERWRAATPSQRRDACTWVAFPLAGFVWMATWYSDMWFYYDEWSTIDRSFGSWLDMFDGHQGHLSVFSFILYRIQRGVFGLDGHEVMWIALMGSVAALQISLAMLLRRLGLSTVFALLVATVVTYFGPGAQDVVWQFQWNINLALALSFLAAYLVIGDRRDQRTAITVAVLLVVAVAADSGVAALGAGFVGILTIMTWPRRLSLLTLVPAVVAHLAWTVFGDNPHYSASFEKVWDLANRMFVYSAAALVGGGETRSTHGGTAEPPVIGLSAGKLGVIVLLVAAVVIGFGIARRRLSKPVVVALIAGLCTAVAGCAMLAWSRAFLVEPSDLFGSRYLQWIALFLVIALAPALAASVRDHGRVPHRVMSALAAVALVAIFAINLEQFWPVRDFYEAKGQETKLVVGETVSLLREGCGGGRDPRPGAEPSSELAPQISVRLVEALVEDGALANVPVVEASATTRRAVCRANG